ncbi:MAG TPA: stage II sporulation protein R [Ruminococcaceae bacterium]|jgi:stage II sporulation protein R|nr:stage II sporulation protein R [Oscillospiraceae bacterium]HBQ46810.1 stage II sporulation protein R [Oscillospiraceae bacterium]HBT91020.1 stage II sporulation protein R [Oscillospiraceae bacterium]HCB91763.1 stage II sporulation protein R [Oscillospiraceae bacterium]
MIFLNASERKENLGMKVWEKSLCLAFALTVLFSFAGFAAGCEDIPNHILRLHVLANSDSREDQALKLKVRDRILAESAGMLDGVKTREEAERAVAENLPRLQKAAEDEVRKQGASCPVRAELANLYFTSRRYGDVTLPAGRYDALQVTLGTGKGHNWWCVLFPALCLPAAEAPAELQDVLDRGEMEIVEGKDGEGYILKFKSVELYQQFRGWLQQRFG